MKLKSVQLQENNRLIKAYRNQSEKVSRFFHYHPYNDYGKRLEDLQKRFYKREELADVLWKMNEKWDANPSTYEQINRLRQTNSVVVIGGQQAGLLTGPIYTVNKIISIIKLAKEQEKILQVPVIPVFWIAGEDHDFQEVNHIFSSKGNGIYKHTIKQQQNSKKPVSHIKLDKDQTFIWLKEILNDIPETRYTKEWFDKTIQSLEASDTYVDFFARLLYQLFPDEGIVLIDSHHPDVRQLEKDYFKLLITNQQEMNQQIYQTVQSLQQEGYNIPLDVELQDANLFIQDDDDERILLKREHDQWIGKNEEVLLTIEEMYNIVKESPERLSNNVMTRPVMQELLFPTLAFVGGNGEISYWAALKGAFEILNITMPPVVPRLSFTYITNRTKKLLELRHVEAEKVVNEGLEDAKLNWLNTQENAPVDLLFDEGKESIRKIHYPLQQFTASISDDLYAEARKNLQYMEQQIDYLKRKTMNKLQEKYAIPISQFEELNIAIKPLGVLQERIWNPYCFINKYGYSFLKQLTDLKDVSFHHEHYLVYLEE